MPRQSQSKELNTHLSCASMFSNRYCDLESRPEAASCGSLFVFVRTEFDLRWSRLPGIPEGQQKSTSGGGHTIALTECKGLLQLSGPMVELSNVLRSGTMVRIVDRSAHPLISTSDFCPRLLIGLRDDQNDV